tara:strand:+ start:82 stop:516 length:435 start_codon:yes stop_codon:yes gene_type:complete
MTPDEKKIYNKEYREKNKEKEKEYREKNKERNKEYREKNKEKLKEYSKEYNKNNLEKIKEIRKEYNKTEQGKKSYRISNWKSYGVISDDFNSLYKYYLDCDKCEECFINLTTGKRCATSKCLDHSHETGEFRNVVCFNCNIKRG